MLLNFIFVAHAADPCSCKPLPRIEAPVSCEKLTPPTREEFLASWRAFQTSAPMPRPKVFKYVVSAMDLRTADLVRDDKGVRMQRPVVFTSLIDQDHTMTFGTSGIILDPIAEQVAVAVPYDTATTWCDDFNCRNAQPTEINRKLAGTRARHGVYSPESVLAGTIARNGWNEVILNAAGDAERPLRVKGLYLTVDANDKPVEYREGEEKQVFEAAEKYGLPVTRIRRNSPANGPAFEVPSIDGEVSQITFREEPRVSQIDFESQLRAGKGLFQYATITNVNLGGRQVDMYMDFHKLDPLIARLRVEIRRDPKLARAVRRALERLACTPDRANDESRYLTERLSGS